MALTETTGNFVEQVTGGRKAMLDGDLAHKGKYSVYTSAGVALSFDLNPDECYVKATSTASGALTCQLPDVSVAKGRRYTVDFTKATTNMIVEYTGTSTGDLTVSASAIKIFRSDGTNWILEA